MSAELANYYLEPRKDVADLVPQSALRILDVGCGGGGLGRELLRRNPARQLVGIEFVPEAAAKAREVYATVYSESVEESAALEAEEKFDCILLADVIEHTAAPEKVLARLQGLLRDGGCIIASVPNVSHYSVILGLLLGRWRYADRGILDRTHLRFFTQSSFLQLAREAGFACLAVHPNYRLFEARGLRYDAWLALPLSLYFMRHLFVFQYRFVLRPL